MYCTAKKGLVKVFIGGRQIFDIGLVHESQRLTREGGKSHITPLPKATYSSLEESPSGSTKEEQSQRMSFGKPVTQKDLFKHFLLLCSLSFSFFKISSVVIEDEKRK